MKMFNYLKKLILPLALMCAMVVPVPVMAQETYQGNGPQPNLSQNGEVVLSNLDIRLQVPVVSKSGMGVNFLSVLTFDNNLWYLPTTNYNWLQKKPFTPFLESGDSVLGTLRMTSYGSGNGFEFLNYQDPSGGIHPFNLILNPTANPTTKLATDGSGYTLNYQGSGLPTTVIASNGTIINPSAYWVSGTSTSEVATSAQDVNANSVSLVQTGSAGNYTYTYTDTLGVAELIVNTQGSYYQRGNSTLCAGATSTYTYPTSTGSATVTLTCAQKTVTTAFGCPGIVEATTAVEWTPVSISLPDGSSYSFGYETYASGYTSGRISSITFPNGAVHNYTYTGGSGGVDCHDGTTAGLTVGTPEGTWVYTRDITYKITTVVDPSGNKSVYTYLQQGSNPKSMYLTQAQMYQGASTLLKTEVFCYNGNLSNCVTTLPGLPITEIDSYTTITGMSSKRATSFLDLYGNVIESDVYDFGAAIPFQKTCLASNCSTVPPTGSLFGYTWNGSTTSPNCASLIGNGIMDKPCQIQLLTGTGPQLKNSYVQYSATGHALKTGVLVAGSYVTSSALYNTNGSVNTTYDPNNQSTLFTEGACNNGFPTIITPAISSLAVRFGWDCNGSKDTSITDPNGFSTSSGYVDPFWRETSAGAPSLEFAGTVYTNTTYNSPNEVETVLNFNGGNSISDVYIKTFPTTFNNVETQVLEGPSSSNWDTSDSSLTWDSTGIVNQSWAPCISTTKGGGCSSAIFTTTHDALSRPLVKTDGGNGWINYSYIMGSTKYDVLAELGPAPTGEVTKKVQKEYNGLGQLLSSCLLSSASGMGSCGQVNGGTGVLSVFSYNTDGTLASAVRGSQTHAFTYDNIGRVLTSTTPEGGLKQFFYDSAPSTPGVACSTLSLPTNYSPVGHLLKTYDANGTTACFSYDQIGRNTGIAYSGTKSDGNNKYFLYDSATVNSVVMANTKGRIAEAYTAPTFGGTKVTDQGYSYNSRGLISDVYQWSTHSGGWYHTSATYFDDGSVNTLTGVPSNTPWIFGLDGKGRSKTAAISSTNMVTNATYNAADQPRVITLGVGDTDTYTYDDNTGRMTSYDFAVGATPKHFTGTPSWNVNGTLRGLTVVDGVNTGAPDSEVCAYGDSTHPGYDAIGRLLKVDCWNGGTAVWGQDFSYDTYDNLTKTVPSGQTGTTWNPTYSAINNTYSGATYDSNGNLLNDTFNSYTWNQDNHPKTVGASNTLTYDAFGRLVEYYNGAWYEKLISPIGEIAVMKAQVTNQYRMPLPGGSTATTGINFQHADNLGSAPFVSGRGTRTNVSTRLFSPFGEVYNVTGNIGNVNFTGDHQDLVVGLYDTPNRELNSSGRWTYPDPAGASWNAYAYSTNPMSETDPTGLGNAADDADLRASGVWGGGGWSSGAQYGAVYRDADYFNQKSFDKHEEAINPNHVPLPGGRDADGKFVGTFNVRGSGATSIDAVRPGSTITNDFSAEPDGFGQHQQRQANTAPADSRTDIQLYGREIPPKPYLSLTIKGWTMDWYAGACSNTSCPQPNENSKHTFRLMESLNDGPWGPKGTPEHGMAHDQFTPYPETANQHWFVDDKQVQVVVGVDRSTGRLIKTWEVRVVITQTGKRPEYSAVP